ncbi:tetratricopeptide repeat protein [Massilia sp. DWR3-1-1]|uniref:tetratricopeptide repeat protein n=1 Tax=Massilia sp. DWR3-1-1 TaxID=2804559 RepID=UPI003CE7E4AC
MKSIRQVCRFPSRSIVTLAFLCEALTACKMDGAAGNVLPRNEKLPLLDPHVASYTCAPAQLPPFDAQADAWFQEARALESPRIFDDERDYKKIVALTHQAAQRQHWKAMLNLASFYLEGRDPPHGAEDAVQLVEAAMRLGVPAAYDRMGTYYMNGSGVRADATRAYAFWQRAAQMGSPDALADLGRKLISVDDHPERDRWANEAVGTKMLECAYSQGHGPAAYALGFQYSMPTGRNPKREELERALLAWHNGVKFGSAKCAAAISGEFRSFSNEPDRMVLHTDLARSERYYVLARALEFDPDRRFPNLDKILPLPPADLPPWHGDRDTLINAARGISHEPSPPRSPSAYSERKGRFYLDPIYRLAPTDEIAPSSTAPFAGDWQPITAALQLFPHHYDTRSQPCNTKDAASSD